MAGLRASAPRGLGLALFALTAAVFAPSLCGDFLNYDDDLYVSANPALANGLDAESLRFAFTSFYGANWFPLTWLSWLLDLSLFGFDARALHATNVLLHAGASALLYTALRRLTGCVWTAAFAAALFALHPTRVEAVAWIAARKDPLAALFATAALSAYAGQRAPGPGAARLARVAALYALGLLAKPSVIPLPALLLLLDYWPLGRLAGSAAGAAGSERSRIDRRALRRCVVEKLPLFALGAAHAAVVFAAQSAAGTVASLEQLGPGARVANALAQLPAYLGALLWPARLAIPYPHLEAAQSLSQILLGVLIFALATAAALASARSHPHRIVGWLWFLVLLLPCSGLVQVGSQARADRYLYLPLIGPALVFAYDAPALLARVGVGRRGSAALAVALLTALSAGSVAQLRFWRDSETLFRHTLAVTVANPIAHAHLGLALETQGRRAEAVAEYRRALALRADLQRVANRLAWLLATAPEPSLQLGGEALALAERAAAQSSRRDANVLDTLAAALAASGRYVDAVSVAAEAATLARREERYELALAIEMRAALYSQGRPYRR